MTKNGGPRLVLFVKEAETVNSGEGSDKASGVFQYSRFGELQLVRMQPHMHILGDARMVDRSLSEKNDLHSPKGLIDSEQAPLDSEFQHVRAGLVPFIGFANSRRRNPYSLVL